MSAALDFSHQISLLVHFLSCHPNFRQERTYSTESFYTIPWAHSPELALTQRIAEFLSRWPGERSYAVSCLELPDGFTIFVSGDVSPNPGTSQAAAGADYEDDMGLEELRETLKYISGIVKRVKTVAAMQRELDGRRVKRDRKLVRQAVFEEPVGVLEGMHSRVASNDVQVHQESNTSTAKQSSPNRGQFQLPNEVRQEGSTLQAEIKRVVGPPEQLDIYRFVISACRAKITHRWIKYFHALHEFFYQLHVSAELFGQDPFQTDPIHASPSDQMGGPPPTNPYFLFRHPDDKKLISFLSMWCLKFGAKLLEPGYLDRCLKASSPHSDNSASVNSSSSSDETEVPVSENEIQGLIYIASKWPDHPETMADIDSVARHLNVLAPGGMPMSRAFRKCFSQFKAVDDLISVAKRRRFYAEVLERPIIIESVRVLPATECGLAVRRSLPTTPGYWKSLLTRWLYTIPLDKFEMRREVLVDNITEIAARRAVSDDPDKLPPGSGFVCAELQLMTYFLHTGEELGRFLSRYGSDWKQLMTEEPLHPQTKSSPSSASYPTSKEQAEMSKLANTPRKTSDEIPWRHKKRIPFGISKSTSCQACRLVMGCTELQTQPDEKNLGNMFRYTKVVIAREPINDETTNTARGPIDNSCGPVPLQHCCGCTATKYVNKHYASLIPPTDGRFVSGGTPYGEWAVYHDKDGREIPSNYGGCRVPKGCLWLLPMGLEEKLGAERIMHIVKTLVNMLEGGGME